MKKQNNIATKYVPFSEETLESLRELGEALQLVCDQLVAEGKIYIKDGIIYDAETCE